MDEVVYKTMKDLIRRLKQAWKKIPLSTLHDFNIPLHAATASERDNKQRGTCRMLTLRIYLLSKAVNVFEKFHAEV